MWVECRFMCGWSVDLCVGGVEVYVWVECRLMCGWSVGLCV